MPFSFQDLHGNTFQPRLTACPRHDYAEGRVMALLFAAEDLSVQSDAILLTDSRRQETPTCFWPDLEFFETRKRCNLELVSPPWLHKTTHLILGNINRRHRGRCDVHVMCWLDACTPAWLGNCRLWVV